ncbi:predicted protein [Uncinocarpus reesii 1704]|uniref:DNA (cytosine-5)-methyltransferase 1 replication foci domain-containing protein n=1 Tax=Uncinocarpus reesii (strain UAMH 1704) TaxID=336963 RepID=C4JRE8_UNCRE|nr:uncharacterized protein UREG_05037 [Uncinocarpus reesii 1704]EEP80195.1 predicted protein [Uncinocarpus reesii 1704]
MTARIESVLAARNPSLTDENDWEEFALTDVRVRVPGKARYANLLTASPESPVSVTGQLELVEQNQESLGISHSPEPAIAGLLINPALVLDENYRSKRVIIENVTHYAYGQHEDGEVGIWVAGEPGWFSITPAKGYKPVFNEMIEAVDLLYFIIDKHQPKGRRRKQWNPKMDYLFDQHTYGACEDADDAAEVFDKHHAFLIKQMVQGKEDVDWDTAPVYKYFREKYSELFGILEEKGSNEDHISDGNEVDNEDAESVGTETVEKSQADTIFETILDMKESTRDFKRQLTLKTAAEQLLKRYEMDSLDYAINLIKARAAYLIEMMDNANTLSSIDWSRRTIYRQLKAAERSKGVQDVRTTPLHPRPVEDQGDQSSSVEESEDENFSHHRRHARMSILRPKSSVSAKRARKSGKQPPNETSDSEQESEDIDISEETPTRRLGSHRLIQQPLPSRVSELARSIISISEPSTSSPKKVAPLEMARPSETTAHPINGNHITMPPAALISPEVDLPRDTWVCSVQGCGKTVLKASSKRSKEVILDHSLAHADDTQTKMSLVFAEQRLNVNASVDFLLNRIREFGTLEGEPSDAGMNSDAKRIRLGE